MLVIICLLVHVHVATCSIVTPQVRVNTFAKLLTRKVFRNQMVSFSTVQWTWDNVVHVHYSRWGSTFPFNTQNEKKKTITTECQDRSKTIVWHYFILTTLSNSSSSFWTLDLRLLTISCSIFLWFNNSSFFLFSHSSWRCLSASIWAAYMCEK